ncbi:MAG TPA: hypothetical protein VED18_13060 [Candidatus Sulfotelmatobacter sp.]|nr:hypothetical protein [Candidatus Sulfotelmatobacter sp.]
MATKFCDIPIGTVFRLDGEDLLSRLTNARELGPFRKVAADGAAHTADRREAKWYLPPEAAVVQMEQQDKGTDPLGSFATASPDPPGAT